MRRELRRTFRTGDAGARRRRREFDDNNDLYIIVNYHIMLAIMGSRLLFSDYISDTIPTSVYAGLVL